MRAKASPDVDVCRIDELRQGGGIERLTGPQFHVAPAFAGPLEQPSRVGQQHPKEEADVDVIAERVHVSKCGIADAGGRAAVVHQLADVVSALPHPREPRFDQRPEIVTLGAQPGVDRGRVRHGRRQAKDVIHWFLSRGEYTVAS